LLALRGLYTTDVCSWWPQTKAFTWNECLCAGVESAVEDGVVKSDEREKYLTKRIEILP
jgi:hypothetical protein